MEKTLKMLNELEEKGLIDRYAIGGGIAALFYAEPFLTYDIDVFVFLPTGKSRLVLLSPIYNYLKEKGYQAHKEHVIIEEIPIQFIPAYNALVGEAVEEAVEVKYKRVKTKVLRAEHLFAIMLQTDRPKDRARMTVFLEEAKMDKGYLRRIIRRHGLAEKWQKFRSFYGI